MNNVRTHFPSEQSKVQNKINFSSNEDFDRLMNCPNEVQILILEALKSGQDSEMAVRKMYEIIWPLVSKYSRLEDRQKLHQILGHYANFFKHKFYKQLPLNVFEFLEALHDEHNRKLVVQTITTCTNSFNPDEFADIFTMANEKLRKTEADQTKLTKELMKEIRQRILHKMTMAFPITVEI